MYACENCGGALKFDVASQQLACESCSTKFDPYKISKEKDGEQDDYDVTIFKCPQCGGEIYSMDNTAAGFCSFCGASTVLTSRLEKGSKINYIIPFAKTKDDCKAAYAKTLKHALFAPKELRDPHYIDSFRGIYMPYWVFHLVEEGPTKVHGTTSHRSGDYIITRHYGLHMDLDAQYKGVSYDASSSFSDTISEKLAPYDVKNMKKFTPSYLSGFYADMADVGPRTYGEDAKIFAQNRTADFIRKSPGAKGYALDSNDKMRPNLPTRIAGTDSAMFPVWFLSYRKNNRVAYATVNGQTGKVVADMPVDFGKYMITSVIMAVIIFILLNLFLTIRPTILVPIVALIASIVVLLHGNEMKQISIQEAYEDDKGAQVGLEIKRQKQQEAEQKAMAEMGITDDSLPAYQMNRAQVAKTKKKKKNPKSDLFMVLTILFMMLPISLSLLASVGSMGFGIICDLIALVLAIIGFVKSNKYIKQVSDKGDVSASLYAFLPIILSLCVTLTNTIHDTIYYVTVIVATVGVVITLLDLMKSYNLLATRRLPQFDYKGGDDLA